jgi:hypothetical protein
MKLCVRPLEVKFSLARGPKVENAACANKLHARCENKSFARDSRKMIAERHSCTAH